MSHRGSQAACVVGDRRQFETVGIDMENIRPVERVDALARRYFAPDEWSQALANAPNKETAFFSLWTLKESYAKARGFGLYIQFPAIRFFNVFGPAGSIRVEFNATLAEPQRGDRTWRFWLQRPRDTWVVAVAALADASAAAEDIPQDAGARGGCL